MLNMRMRLAAEPMLDRMISSPALVALLEAMQIDSFTPLADGEAG